MLNRRNRSCSVLVDYIGNGNSPGPTAAWPGRARSGHFVQPRQRTHRERPHAAELRRHGAELEPLVRHRGHVAQVLDDQDAGAQQRSEEHTSELQSLMRISYAVFCLKKKTTA